MAMAKISYFLFETDLRLHRFQSTSGITGTIRRTAVQVFLFGSQTLKLDTKRNPLQIPKCGCRCPDT